MTGRDGLLCVANYPANTGYAWDFIEGVYARLADHLATHGVRTFVAYPSLPSPPRTLAGSAATPVELDVSLGSAASVRGTRQFVRDNGIAALYLTDHSARSFAYPLVRAAGVRRIVVHDHTSGVRDIPTGFRRAAKRLVGLLPGVTADVVVTVSEYVARRQVNSGLVPVSRVVRVWNALAVPESRPAPDLAQVFGWQPGRPVVACACRVTPEKGVDILLHAFRAVLDAWPDGKVRPVLLHMGSGPFHPELVALHERLELGTDAVLAGYRPDAATLLAGADICVVPSVWQEAFGLAALEPMARGKAVIGTSVGGIPEVVEDNVTGLLVAPGDVPALARAIRRLLDEPIFAAELGRAGRVRAAERFSPERQLARLAAVVEPAFLEPCPMTRTN